MVSCNDIKEAVSGFSLVQECDVVKSGAVRLMTPFSYPDGSNIDVFVKTSEPLFGKVELSDLGQTVDWLGDFHIDPNKTQKRRQLVSDVCRTLGVNFDGWQLKSDPVAVEEITQAMVALAQACIRVADLMYTHRLQANSVLKDEVEEFISDLELPYETDPKIEGVKGKLITLDFRVKGRARDSLVLLLARGSHVSATEVFTRWYDVRNTDAQFLTIYDDTRDAQIREIDESRIEDFSLILPWQDRRSIGKLLVA
ncbi:MAG: DUF1828 domain-containing protein [Bacteriovoracia bacterium]